MNRLAYLAGVLWKKLTVPQKVFYIFVIIMLLLAGRETYKGEHKKQMELNEAITTFYKISLPRPQNITRIEISNRLGGTYSISCWYKKERGIDEEVSCYRKMLLDQGYIEKRENKAYLFTRHNDLTGFCLEDWGNNIFWIDIMANRPIPVYGKE